MIAPQAAGLQTYQRGGPGFGSSLRLLGPLAVSPDGSKVAIVSLDRNDSAYPGENDLQVISIDDSSIRKVTNLPGFYPHTISWSTDGTVLNAWVSVMDPDSDIIGTATEMWMISVQGGGIEKVRAGSSDISFISISPDRNHAIYAVRSRDRRSILTRMDRLFQYVNQTLYP